MNAKNYRPDIDGLRALAVVPVVLYHAGVSGFTGGFVGVDIFFVISGYLIAGIIHREIQSGTFTIAGFYERRARRILPALVGVMTFAAAAGWFLLLPDAFSDLGASVLATTLFASNFWFWRNTGGYFDRSSEFEPLLHTWSLAVEEQFYIFFPLLLLLLARRSTRFQIGTILALCGVSFAMSIFALDLSSAATFYLLPTRAWELGLGVLLALVNVPLPKSTRIANLVGFGSILVLMACIGLYSSATPFPGLAAAPICLATAALIWTGSAKQGLVYRLLSQPSFVFIGLVSYSWYLWHWPIFAYIRVYTGKVEMTAWVIVLAIATSFVLAVLSWKFIEGPFRSGRSRQWPRKFVLAGGAATSLACASAAGAVFVYDGLPGRMPPQIGGIISAAADGKQMRLDCTKTFPEAPCSLGLRAKGGKYDFIVFGDSHAEAILPAIDASASAAGLKGTAATAPACPPLLGIQRADVSREMSEKCQNVHAGMLEFLKENPDTQMVILAARWAIAYEGKRPEGELGADAILADLSQRNAPNSGDNPTYFMRGLQATIDAITKRGVRVVIIGNVPEIKWHVPDAMSRRVLFGAVLPDAPTLSGVKSRIFNSERALSMLAAQDPNVLYVPLASTVCPDQCITHMGNTPLYRDDDHLSAAGAKYFLGEKLKSIFAELG